MTSQLNDPFDPYGSTSEGLFETEALRRRAAARQVDAEAAEAPPLAAVDPLEGNWLGETARSHAANMANDLALGVPALVTGMAGAGETSKSLARRYLQASEAARALGPEIQSYEDADSMGDYIAATGYMAAGLVPDAVMTLTGAGAIATGAKHGAKSLVRHGIRRKMAAEAKELGLYDIAQDAAERKLRRELGDNLPEAMVRGARADGLDAIEDEITRRAAIAAGRTPRGNKLASRAGTIGKNVGGTLGGLPGVIGDAQEALAADDTTTADAWKLGTTTIAAAATSMLPMERFLSKFGGGEALKKAARMTTRQRVGKVGKEALLQSQAEGGQEALQQAILNAGHAWMQENMEPLTGSDAMRQYAASYIAGAVLGGLMGGGAEGGRQAIDAGVPYAKKKAAELRQSLADYAAKIREANAKVAEKVKDGVSGVRDAAGKRFRPGDMMDDDAAGAGAGPDGGSGGIGDFASSVSDTFKRVYESVSKGAADLRNTTEDRLRNIFKGKATDEELDLAIGDLADWATQVSERVAGFARKDRQPTGRQLSYLTNPVQRHLMAYVASDSPLWGDAFRDATARSLEKLFTGEDLRPEDLRMHSMLVESGSIDPETLLGLKAVGDEFGGNIKASLGNRRESLEDADERAHAIETGLADMQRTARAQDSDEVGADAVGSDLDLPDDGDRDKDGYQIDAPDRSGIGGVDVAYAKVRSLEDQVRQLAERGRSGDYAEDAGQTADDLRKAYADTRAQLAEARKELKAEQEKLFEVVRGERTVRNPQGANLLVQNQSQDGMAAWDRALADPAYVLTGVTEQVHLRKGAVDRPTLLNVGNAARLVQAREPGTDGRVAIMRVLSDAISAGFPLDLDTLTPGAVYHRGPGGEKNFIGEITKGDIDALKRAAQSPEARAELSRSLRAKASMAYNSDSLPSATKKRMKRERGAARAHAASVRKMKAAQIKAVRALGPYATADEKAEAAMRARRRFMRDEPHSEYTQQRAADNKTESAKKEAADRGYGSISEWIAAEAEEILEGKLRGAGINRDDLQAGDKAKAKKAKALFKREGVDGFDALRSKVKRAATRRVNRILARKFKEMKRRVDRVQIDDDREDVYQGEDPFRQDEREHARVPRANPRGAYATAITEPALDSNGKPSGKGKAVVPAGYVSSLEVVSDVKVGSGDVDRAVTRAINEIRQRREANTSGSRTRAALLQSPHLAKLRATMDANRDAFVELNSAVMEVEAAADAVSAEGKAGDKARTKRRREAIKKAGDQAYADELRRASLKAGPSMRARVLDEQIAKLIDENPGVLGPYEAYVRMREAYRQAKARGDAKRAEKLRDMAKKLFTDKKSGAVLRRIASLTQKADTLRARAEQMARPAAEAARDEARAKLSAKTSLTKLKARLRRAEKALDAIARDKGKMAKVDAYLEAERKYKEELDAFFNSPLPTNTDLAVAVALSRLKEEYEKGVWSDEYYEHRVKEIEEKREEAPEVRHILGTEGGLSGPGITATVTNAREDYNELAREVEDGRRLLGEDEARAHQAFWDLAPKVWSDDDRRVARRGYPSDDDLADLYRALAERDVTKVSETDREAIASTRDMRAAMSAIANLGDWRGEGNPINVALDEMARAPDSKPLFKPGQQPKEAARGFVSDDGVRQGELPLDPQELTAAERAQDAAKREAAAEQKKKADDARRQKHREQDLAAKRAASPWNKKFHEDVIDDAEFDAGVESMADAEPGEHDHKAEAAMLNALLVRLGLDPDIVVTPLDDPRDNQVGGKYTRSDARIHISDSLTGAERVEVLLHELGHHIVWAYIAKEAGVPFAKMADMDIKAALAMLRETNKPLADALLNDYNKWRATHIKRNSTELAVRKSRSPYHRYAGLEKRTPGQGRNLSALSERNREYILGVNEWLADNIARALSSKKESQTIIGKFFKKIADALKKLYATVFSGGKLAAFKPAESVDAWIQGLFDGDVAAVKAVTGITMPAADAKDVVSAAVGTAMVERSKSLTVIPPPPPNGDLPPVDHGPKPARDPGSFTSMMRYVRKYLRPQERQILTNVLNTAAARRQLERLYAHHPYGEQILGLVNSGRLGMEARIAAAYYAYRAGLFTTGPNGEAVLTDLGDDLMSVFGMVGEGEYAQRIFADIANGVVEAQHSRGGYDVRKLEEKRAAARGKRNRVMAQNKFMKVYNRLSDMVGKYTDGKGQRMLDSGVPAIRAIASLLQRPIGTYGEDRGYIPAARDAIARFGYKLDTIYKDLTPRQALRTLRLLQRGETNLDGQHDAVKLAVTRTRGLLDQMYDYMKAAGVDVGRRENFFPIIFDIGRPGFEADLAKLLSDPDYEQPIRDLFEKLNAGKAKEGEKGKADKGKARKGKARKGSPDRYVDPKAVEPNAEDVAFMHRIRARLQKLYEASGSKHHASLIEINESQEDALRTATIGGLRKVIKSTERRRDRAKSAEAEFTMNEEIKILERRIAQLEAAAKSVTDAGPAAMEAEAKGGAKGEAETKEEEKTPIKELIDNLVRGAASVPGAPSTGAGAPNFRGANMRLMSFIEEVYRDALASGDADRIARHKANMKTFSRLQARNPGSLLARYVVPMVKNAEYSRRFGNDGAGLRRMLDQAKAQGATDAQIEEATNAVKAALGTYGAEGSPTLAAISPALAKRFSGDKTKAFIHGTQAYQNWRLLPLSVLSSLGDWLGIAVRSGGDFSMTWQGFRTGIKSLWDKSSREEMQHALALLGATDDLFAEVALDQGQSDFAKAANELLFRYNGLTAWTRATRYMALEAAHTFIATHASMPGEHSERYLKELGLRPGGVPFYTHTMPNGESRLRVALLSEAQRAHLEFIAKGVIQVDSKGTAVGGTTATAKEARKMLADDDRLRNALMQFVDEAIIRPNSQQTPMWVSDPYMGLFAQYKAFAYALYDTIPRRVLHELASGNGLKPALAAAALIPMMIAAELLRELIQNLGEDERRKNWGPAEYLVLGIERASLYSPRKAMAEDLYSDYKRGNFPGTSQLGPTGQQANNIRKALSHERSLGKEFESAIPTSALWRKWNDAA